MCVQSWSQFLNNQGYPNTEIDNDEERKCVCVCVCVRTCVLYVCVHTRACASTCVVSIIVKYAGLPPYLRDFSCQLVNHDQHKLQP